MTAESRTTPAKHFSWKQSRDPEHLAPISKNAKRWMTTVGVGLFAAVLVGALWFWLNLPVRNTIAVLFPLSNYHSPDVPPNPGADGDSLALEAILPLQNLNRYDLQTASDMAALGPFFKNLPAKKNDVLLVYLSGHGVSRDGVAYVLPSDTWARRDELDGKCDIPTLLSGVAGSAAGHKLLILDTGRLDADPRLGMAINEFPRLVERDVSKNQDAPWVLLPAGMFQTTLVDYVKGRSHFGRLVEEALAGNADTNKDYAVSLQEFYVYVASGLAPYEQTPLLLRGGVEKVVTAEMIPKLELVRYSKKKPASDKDKEQEKTKLDPDAELRKAQKLESEIKSSKSAIENLPNSVKSGNPTLPVLPGALAPAPAATPPTTPAPTGAAPAATPPATTPAKGTAPEGTPAGTPAPATEPGAAKPAVPTGPPTEVPGAPKAPPAEPRPDPATLTLRERLSLALSDCWKLRDRLRRNTDSQIWLPCDYAPHRWRELDAVLLDLERRSRGGGYYETPAVLDHLTGLAKELELLVRAHEPGAPADQDFAPRAADDTLDVVRNIDLARREFRSAYAARVPRAAIPADLAAVVRARQIFHSAVYEASDFLRWQLANVLMTGKPHEGGLADLGTLLAELTTLQKQLDDLGSTTFDNTGRDNLEASAAAVEKTHKSLRTQFAEHAEKLLAPAAPNAENHALRQRQLEAALQTPLADADLRRKLITRLFEASHALSETPVQTKPPAAPRTAPWVELRAVFELESKLLALAELDLSKPTVSAALNKSLRKLDGANENESYAEFRKIGLLLQESQAALFETMRTAFINEKYDTIARGLWLVDPRDAHLLASDLHALDRFDVTRRPALEFGPPPPPVELLETWQPFAIPVVAVALNDKDHSAELRLSFDESRMMVRRGEGTPELRSGAKLTVPIGELMDGAIRYQARSKQAESAGGPVPLDLNVDLTLKRLRQTDLAPLLQKIACRLPSPERIALRIQRIDSSRRQDGKGAGVRLEPFPNRETAFQFWLVNESGRKRKVSVALWSIPPTPAATWSPGKLVVAQNQVPNSIRQELFKDLAARVMKMRSDLDPARLLSQTKESLELPEDANSPVEVPFAVWPPQKEPAAGAATPPPAAANGAAPPATVPPGPDISHGLLCVITDDEKPDRQWLEWIEILPLRPERYLQSKVRYNVGMQRVEAEVTLRKDLDNDGHDDKVPGLVKTPVNVQLQFDESQFSAEGLHRSTELARPGETRTLYVGARADGLERRLALSVDNFPRAYRYGVKCDEISREAVPVTNQAALRIVGLSARYNGSDLPGSKEAREEFFDFTSPGATRRAMFPAPAGELLVGLEVDVPEDAFVETAGRDVVELRLRGQDKRIESFYSDRQARTNLVRLSADGVLTLLSTVSDFSIPVATAGLENIRVDLDAGLFLEGASRAEARPVEVQLDGKRPRVGLPINVRVIPGPKAVVLQADVLAEDGSLGTGVRLVEFGIDKNHDGKVDDKDVFQPAVVSKGNGLWSIAWDLSKLELAPEQYYELFVRATDRVGWVGTPGEDKVAGFTYPALKDVTPQVSGTIKGSVRLRDTLVTRLGGKARATLEIRDSAGKLYVGEADEKGEYIITGVPTGKHKLTVKGEFLSTRFAESYEIEIPAVPGAEKIYDIKLK